jgi:hypothetical protein
LRKEGAVLQLVVLSTTAITAFPALAPRLRSVVYPDNFKPNIQKYNRRSDPNI